MLGFSAVSFFPVFFWRILDFFFDIVLGHNWGSGFLGNFVALLGGIGRAPHSKSIFLCRFSKFFGASAEVKPNKTTIGVSKIKGSPF